MHFGIIVFPGSNCDRDCAHVVEKVLGHTQALVWHEQTDLSAFDIVVLPGGFAHGDYLRTGAIARFSPIMDAVSEFASLGKPVIGICNGFQILCEAHLLPGALRRNAGLHFICKVDSQVRVEHNENQFLNRTDIGDVLTLPIRHGEGSYYADVATIASMEAHKQILLRYSDAEGRVSPETNPNGSVGNIAGIMNREGTVFGLMPHPEAASEMLLGSADGLLIFRSLLQPMTAHLSTTSQIPSEARLFSFSDSAYRIHDHGYLAPKTEPTVYSYADLERDGQTMWDGVSQPHALQNLRKMEKGDLAIIYHTGDERQAVGLADVVKGYYVNPEKDDPKLAVVDVKAKKKLKTPVTLKQVKAHPILKDWDLARLARLSVVAVSDEQWKILQELARGD